MKHTNFVATLSPQQQYEIRRWFIASTVITVITMISIISYCAPSLYSLYAMKKEMSYLRKKTHTYTELTSKRDALKKENELLQKKRTKIDGYRLEPKNPLTYITAFINMCNNGIIAEHIKNNKKNIELIIVCPTTDNATTVMQQLMDTGYFAEIKIHSLQQHDKSNQLRCTLKGVMKRA